MFDEADPRWKLVQDILASRTFAKSVRLSDFLSYICRRTLEGRTQEVNEQQIGMHVFSRSPAYNANEDSIVRTQARLLRLKLEEYFEHERPGGPLILRIPKGGYIPLFERNPALEPQEKEPGQQKAPELTIEPAPPTTHMEQVAAGKSGRIGLVAALILIFVLLATDVTLRLRSTPQSPGAPHLLWSRIFDKQKTTVIVPSDDAVVLFQELTKSPVPLDEYLSGSFLEKVPAGTSAIPLTANWLTSHQYTSMADLNLAIRLQRLPEALSGRPETRYARDVRMEDLKNKNAILIGGIGANPWVEVFQGQLNFDVNYDWKAAEGYVINKVPKQGEPASYRETSSDGRKHNYGVLAFLPGIDGKGDVLLVQGTGMAGTESAADLAFNEESFGAFLRQIGATSDHLPHFEVLLETASIGGNAPTSKILAYRLVNP